MALHAFFGSRPAVRSTLGLLAAAVVVGGGLLGCGAREIGTPGLASGAGGAGGASAGAGSGTGGSGGSGGSGQSGSGGASGISGTSGASGASGASGTSGASGASGTAGSAGEGAVACDAVECGPAPGMPSQICPDGSTAGPVCERLADGTCGWRITQCPTSTDHACGAYSSYACGAEEYCDAPDCGTGSETGICQPRPGACTRELNPVCGCDGNDYANPCMARSAGTEVDHAGACGASGTGCGDTGQPCPKGQFCSYPVGDCGQGDDPGSCQTQPQMCTMEYNPVCGCDGKNYGNACGASGAGVSVAHAGEC